MKITSFSVRPLSFMNLLWPLIVKASPGPDRIEYILIVKLPLSTKLILLDLLNEIYSLNIYPPAWKENLTFFIDKKDGNAVGTISLTSCLCNILEKMIKSRLPWWLEPFELHPLLSLDFHPVDPVLRTFQC